MVDKKELQEAFEKHLIEKGGYPKESIYRDWEVASNRVAITLDIAIVINDIVIQAFQLFDNTIENESSQTVSFTQTIDSVEVKSEVLFAIYDSIKESWEFKLPNNNPRNIAKCFMTFSTAGKQFLDNAEEKIQERRLIPIVSVLKDKCTRICCACTIYLVLYILFYVGNSNGICNCELPLSWELLILIAIILLFAVLPSLLPFISAIRVGSVEISLVREVFQNMKTKKV
jgi:hypothetical protein